MSLSPAKRKNMLELAAYREKLYREPQLKFLFFELTNACNLACLHCGSSCSPAKGTFLPKELVERTLASVQSQLRERPYVFLTGGEPLLHPDFFPIAEHIHAQGLFWGITTNGMLIDGAAARKLNACGMTSVAFSLDGTRETHNALRRDPHAFDACLRGISNVVKYCGKAVTMVTSVIHRGNIGELNAIHDLVRSLGVDSWRIINVDPIGRAKKGDMLLGAEEMRYLLEYIRGRRYDPAETLDVTYGCSHYLTEDFENETRDAYFLCNSGVYAGSVLCNGDIYSCLDIERRPELVQGNVSRDDFADVWKNKFKQFRTDRSGLSRQCMRCPDRAFCAGDSAHTWNYDENRPNYCVKQLLEGKIC